MSYTSCIQEMILMIKGYRNVEFIETSINSRESLAFSPLVAIELITKVMNGNFRYQLKQNTSYWLTANIRCHFYFQTKPTNHNHLTLNKTF